MKKTFTKIPTNWVNEALQILNNFCSQSTRFCDECYLRNRKGDCLLQTDYPERFDKWKKDKYVE